MATRTETRHERLHLRLSPTDDGLIRAAAEAADVSLTEFVLQAARASAVRTLADRDHVVLAADTWDILEARIRQRGRRRKQTAELFERPSPFEGWTGLTRLEPLGEHHAVEGFDSGEVSLDEWLGQRAWANQLAGFSRTYVTTDGERVVGYYAVSSFAVLRAETTRRAGRGDPKPIPAILLGRLAVDATAQGRGLGGALLRHAMELTVAASETIGVRLLVVNVLHENTAEFYRRLGTEPSPTNPLDLMITVNGIKASM